MVSPGAGWLPLVGTLKAVALVAQGIEQWFPKPLWRSLLCAADLRFLCAECPCRARGVLRVCSGAERLLAKIDYG